MRSFSLSPRRELGQDRWRAAVAVIAAAILCLSCVVLAGKSALHSAHLGKASGAAADPTPQEDAGGAASGQAAATEPDAARVGAADDVEDEAATSADGPADLPADRESAATDDKDPVPTGSKDEMTVLLMGLDGENATEGGPARTDTLMLARIDPDTSETSLLSIPRDLYVDDITPEGEPARINSAYAYGGADKTVRSVEDFTGVGVDHHVVADFAGFEDIVDSLGGIEVEVDGDYLAHKDIPPGEQTLDGREALLYARYRDTPTGDFGRIERQQQLLASLREQALSWRSVGAVPGVVRSLNEHVETDLGAARMVSLALTFTKSNQGGGFDSAQLAGEPRTLDDGREVLEPDDQQNEAIVRQVFPRL